MDYWTGISVTLGSHLKSEYGLSLHVSVIGLNGIHGQFTYFVLYIYFLSYLLLH